MWVEEKELEKAIKLNTFLFVEKTQRGKSLLKFTSNCLDIADGMFNAHTLYDPLKLLLFLLLLLLFLFILTAVELLRGWHPARTPNLRYRTYYYSYCYYCFCY